MIGFRTRCLILALSLGLLGSLAASGQNLAEFEKRVTAFTLSNGMKFIVVERHDAPVVSFMTFANVGSTNETKGITGIAHIFEHMAFKGTKTIGTRDYAGEVPLLEKEDAAFRRLRMEEAKGGRANAKMLERLQKELDAAKEAARRFVVNNEFAEAIEKAGGVGLNAFTSYDMTGYTSSMPSNKIEMWFSMESDRFLNPCLREFYTEKDVIMEERRMSIENTPTGKLFEEFGGVAFLAHPYGEPLIGHMSDLKAISREQAERFFGTHYVASNLTAVIVGDVTPAACRKLAETYFGRLPKRPRPEPVVTEEPPQRGERRVTLRLESQPYLILGYHKPDFNDPAKVAFDVLDDVLSGGRSSRLYTSLVKEKKIAIRVGTSGDYPGSKYPNLYVFFALPAQGHTPKECEEAILEEIEKLKREPVTAEELAKAKIRARSDLVGGLASNDQIAYNISFYEIIAGDWREMFHRGLEKLPAVTAADIQKLARTYFIPENRSVAVIETGSGTEKIQ
ncbi:MAG TPA: pitrilysin family protein [Candidatus Ozemobacteraceae bacterium]